MNEFSNKWKKTFWLRMEKKLQEKKEEEKNRDTVATVTLRFINLVQKQAVQSTA